MASYHIDDPSLGKRAVNLSPPIAQGAAGTIHRVVGEPGIVVKLYKDPKDLVEYREKIAAMLAARPNLPPFPYNGRTYVQIAWPLATVGNGRGDFVGFVMPEVDIQASTELENVLQKAMRTRKGIPEFYGARVLLATNLAALMAELHGLGHHMVDMKPVNMRFYPQAWYMAILDTDGFSINGQRRLPARQFSDEYIAPEARGKSPEKLGLEQDLFALATIIFRLLNNGLHPFQGVDLRANQPTTLQERIFSGLYTYGVAPHRDVNPAPSSIHEFLEHETRLLFDRAFSSTGNRPTAVEWRDHLRGLIGNNVLVKCGKAKDHAHFSRGCGYCALEKINGPPKSIPPLTQAQWGPSTIGSLSLGQPLRVSVAPTDWQRKALLFGAFICVAFIVVWLFRPASEPGRYQPNSSSLAPVRLPPASSSLAPARLPPASYSVGPVQPPPASSSQAPVRPPPASSSLEPVRLPPASPSLAPVRLPPASSSQAPVRPPPASSSSEPVRLPPGGRF